MKIRKSKQMRLNELIKYVWENEIVMGKFTSNLGTTLYTSNLGGLRLEHVHEYIKVSEYFTVSTEEELTEETELSAILTGVKSSDGRMVYRQHTSLSIARVKEEMALACIEPIVVYATDLNRPMNEITLIWSKDAGIPAEGVIECS